MIKKTNICLDYINGLKKLIYNMLEVNPKKFKKIQNKSIPSPLRPKFRNKNETNMYFLSKENRDTKKIVTLITIAIGLGTLLGLFYFFTS